MPTFPLAYHITFGTYGTRLHGDERGTIYRYNNQPGQPIVGRDEEWEQIERGMLKFPPVVLTQEQRLLIEISVPPICQRGDWRHHASAGGEDHVHVLLTGLYDGKAIRRWLKTWLGEALSARWERPHGSTWWSEAGSVRKVWNETYFQNVYEYIVEQRATPKP